MSLDTNALEQYIIKQYETASQDELDWLEEIFDQRVTDEDLYMTEENIYMTEEDPQMGEDVLDGSNIYENIFRLYHVYLNPQQPGPYHFETTQDIITAMKGLFVEFGFVHGGFKGTSDEEILAAARDYYEWKSSLLTRQRKAQYEKKSGH